MNLKEHIPIMIKDVSTSQEPPASSITPATSSIFESVLDAFKLNRFQPNFKNSFLRAYADYPKRHKDTSPSQEHPQSSSTPAKTPKMSSIFERVLDAFKLNRFQPNFKQGFLRAYADHPKRNQGHQPQSGTPTIIINSSKNS